jgi:hypothetical protein
MMSALRLVTSVSEQEDAIALLLSSAKRTVPDFLDDSASVTRSLYAYETELRSAIQFISNEKYASDFFAQIGIGNPADYLYRIYAVGKQHYFLTSLRYKDLDQSKPFIALEFSTLDIECLIADYASAIYDEYALYCPSDIRYPFFGVEPSLSATVDFYFVGDRVGRLQTGLAQTTNDLVVSKAHDLEWYDEYLECYRDLPVNRTELLVTPESMTSLTKSLEAGLLFVATTGGNYAGTIGAIHSTRYYLHGYLFIEKCLVPSLRGKKLARELESKFIHQLPDASLWLFGEIHPTNTPSLRTAQSTGRTILGCMCFQAFR